jgi:polysaccharide export outer membrane protein
METFRVGLVADVIRKCRFGLHSLNTMILCALLSACAAAPGMRMTGPATLPVKSADEGTPTVEMQVPITEINIALIKQMRDEAARTDIEQGRALASRDNTYTLGDGDVLQITIWDHPELAGATGPQSQGNGRLADPAQGFVIDNNGNVQIPYAGSVHLVGLRIDQAQQTVYSALTRVFVKPQVTVRVASFRAKQIYVDGEVHIPGSVQINDIPMTLYEAINRAGGFNPTADQSRMTLVRDGAPHLLNLPRMLAVGQNPQDIVLRNGDLLHVPSRDDNGVFVMGEVNKPTTAIPMKSGSLTLSDALSQAGSLNANSADAAQLYVIRGSLDAAPKVFRLNAHSPVSMVLANQFELQPKDVVYVDGNGLVRFSRVLSLLLPAFNAGLTAAVVTK